MAMVMGDLVLLQSEVNPVMAKLIDGGLEVTAVHNHLLRSEPLTFYMHVGGHGDPAKMAETIHEALAVSKTPLTVSLRTASRNRPRYRADRPDHRGKRRRQRRGLRDQCSAARRGHRAGNGGRCTIMGGATAINFQPTGGGKAAITGDFALIGTEVNDVVRALRSNGIEVTAIHSHMLTEEPRIIFMHFWANDDAIKLAKGLRAALDKTASVRS
jgi:hypothetical protein